MLARPYRLRTRQDFRQVQTRGQKFVCRSFVVRAVKYPRAIPSRIGFSASQSLGNAVVRNRAKRRLREAVRKAMLKTECSNIGDVAGGGWLFVFSARTGALSLSFPDLINEIRSSIKYLCRAKDTQGLSRR